MNENDFFDEPENNTSQPLTLDNRKEQLSEKIDRELNGGMQILSENTAQSGDMSNIPDTPNTQETQDTETVVEGVSLSKSLPDKEEAVQQTAQPAQNIPIPQQQTVSGNAYSQVQNPYSSGGYVTDYTRGAAVKRAVPKQPLSPGVKAYLIVITSLCVIFLGLFVFECYREYTSDGAFGGDISKWFDTDYGYDFGAFGLPDFGNDSDDKDNKPAPDIDSDITDELPKPDISDIKSAPDAETVIDPDAKAIVAEDQPKNIDSGDYTARNAFRQVEASVVNIVVYKGEVGDEKTKDGTGSGIIVSEDGYILTNSHVINDSKGVGVEIITSEGKSYAATVVGFDIRTDLAIVKIDETGLTPARFVNSDQIEVGQDAIAVGSPGGVEYSHSLTRGCVSALNRTVSSNKLVNYIQTDAAINPGNSGGPLLNSAGQVMGINTIKVVNTEYEGMGFAIPSNTAIEISNDLISFGYVANRVRLGIEVSNYVSSYFSTETSSGVSIRNITDDSPLKGTDVKVGDVITAINGVQTNNFQSLFSEMGKYSPGDTVTLTILRPATAGSNRSVFKVDVTFVADNGETQK